MGPINLSCLFGNFYFFCSFSQGGFFLTIVYTLEKLKDKFLSSHKKI